MAAAIPSDLPSGIRLPRRGPDVARRGKALKERPYAIDPLRGVPKERYPMAGIVTRWARVPSGNVAAAASAAMNSHRCIGNTYLDSACLDQLDSRC
jgi:hypothetical protein